MHRVAPFITLLAMVSASGANAQAVHYNVGRTATPAEILSRAISAAPDGAGLPHGQGTVAEGRKLYREQCAVCHGQAGVQNSAQRAAQYPPLIGGVGTLTGPSPILTVGSYWPYATTVWDYIRRAMPYERPGTLTPRQAYALTAYLLYLNHILPADATVGERSLATIKMPNRDGFIPDPRPDVSIP